MPGPRSGASPKEKIKAEAKVKTAFMIIWKLAFLAIAHNPPMNKNDVACGPAMHI